MLELQDVRKTYLVGEVPVRALRGVNLTVHAGEYVAITGSSGSGKSTLLHIMGALDAPTAGRVRIRGRDLGPLSDDELATVRRRDIGVVFQSFNLYPTMNAWENVALPMMVGAVPRRVRKERALRLLGMVGLADRTEHMPDQLSGGQKQRVAIARALANRPAFLLADEPTGNLDSRSSADIVALLRILHRRGVTIVVVTHEPDVAREADRVVRLEDGRITGGPTFA